MELLMLTTKSRRKHLLYCAWQGEYRRALRDHESLKWYREYIVPRVQTEQEWDGPAKWWWKAKTGQLLTAPQKRDRQLCPLCNERWTSISVDGANKLLTDNTVYHILQECPSIPDIRQQKGDILSQQSEEAWEWLSKPDSTGTCFVLCRDRSLQERRDIGEYIRGVSLPFRKALMGEGGPDGTDLSQRQIRTLLQMTDQDIKDLVSDQQLQEIRYIAQTVQINPDDPDDDDAPGMDEAYTWPQPSPPKLADFGKQPGSKSPPST